MSDTDVVKRSQEYYNSDDADRFYHTIWGGEDIHIGLYQDETEPIPPASRRTVARMADKVKDKGTGGDVKVLDIGAGYGGSARYLVKTFGWEATCLNLSEVQNERDREKNREQGLANKIEVYDGNFEDLPFAEDTYDVVWCQDSILHSGNRQKVFEEVDRVLKTGGVFIFTDILQKEPADKEALQPVYDRIHLDNLGSLEKYRAYAEKLGWEMVEFEDHSHQLPRHYQAVHDELTSRRSELKGVVSDEYVDRMLFGLEKWVAAGRKGLLEWGILKFQKKI